MATQRQRIWAWWFFDWASQPYTMLLMIFVFGPYFSELGRAQYAAEGMDPQAARAATQALWGWGQTVAGVTIAVLAPILGAIADGSGKRMPMVWVFSAFYVLGAWMLWFVSPDAPNLILALFWFGIGLIGLEFSIVFNNALMPDLGSDKDMGRVSGSGFALGYLGGILSVIVVLMFFVENPATGKTLMGLDPAFGLDAANREGTRAVGPLTAVWYVVFMIPFFMWFRESPPKRRIPLGQSLRALGTLILSLGRRQSLLAYLLSSMFYRDAMNALYAFGGVYASGVLGWKITEILVYGIAGSTAAMVFALVGGRLDSARGSKWVITASIWAQILVCLVIAGLSRQGLYGIPFAEGSIAPDVIFYAVGMLSGGAGGTLLAASRTLMVFHTTRDRASEAFGLFALSGRATSFLAPFLVAVLTTSTGSQGLGIALPVIALFLVGLVLLRGVKPMGER